jgi:GTP-sensing pleiotropic transcriptional regulator CodY
MKSIKKNKLIQLWFIIGIIAGFSATIFFTVTYLNEKLLCDASCRVQNEISLILVLLSLFGMFIGSLTYYFISEKYERKITKIHKDINLTLKFLDNYEKTIIKFILENKGETTQSKIVKNTGFSRVRIFRVLKKLEDKGIIIKEPYGMSNIIKLDKDLKEVLIE